MAKYMDLKEMLDQSKNDAQGEVVEAGKSRKKDKKYKQYDNALAVLTRLGRALVKTGGVTFNATKKTYKKAKDYRAKSKAYKKSSKLPVVRATKFVVKQASKVMNRKTYAKMIEYAKKVDFAKVIPSKSTIKAWNNTSYVKLGKNTLPKTDTQQREPIKLSEVKLALNKQYSCLKNFTQKSKNVVAEKIHNANAVVYRTVGRFVKPKKPIVILNGIIRPIRKMEIDTDPYQAHREVSAMLEAEKDEKTKKNDEKTTKNSEKERKNKKASKVRGQYNPAIATAKKVLPFALAVLPGGLAVSFALSSYEMQADKFNQINAMLADEEATRVARESFSNKINEIDGQAWMNADDIARPKAQSAYEQYLTANPNDTKGATNLFYETYNSLMESSLNLNAEDQVLFNKLHTPIANECAENIDEWINRGWQSIGYQDELEAIEKNPELFEAYLNNDPNAVATWDAMVEKVSCYYLDAGIFDVMKEKVGEFASENIFAKGDYTDISVSEYIAMNPELGVVGAVGALGVSAVTYCASRYLINRTSKEQSSAPKVDDKPAVLEAESDSRSK